MGKEQIETTLSKEELEMLQLIILDRKGFFMNQVKKCLFSLDELRLEKREDSDLYHSYELSLETYRKKLNTVDKFYEILIKWG